jgi:hypothetical protein
MAAASLLPARLRMLRKKGFDLQKASRWANGRAAVLVSRPSAFGNPFYIGGFHKVCLAVGSERSPLGWRMITANPEIADASFTHVRDAATAVRLYVDFLRAWGPPKGIEQLKGKNLACFCKLCDRHAAKGKSFDLTCPDCSPCHADVLGMIAHGLRCDAL